jgi:FHA domain
VAQPERVPGEPKLSGQTVIGELLRNMELGRFELAYSVLLPCVFRVYLHPDDHARLSGVVDLIVEDASRALGSRVAELNRRSSNTLLRRSKKSKEYKIACRDWIIDLLPDAEVPAGNVEIHSELNEVAQPGYRGVKTTLTGREPTVTSQRPALLADPRWASERIYAEVRYEDDSGPQVYLITQNETWVGRGGDNPMDLALYASDEVSREHLLLRRDPATGLFVIIDQSTNGTWLNGRRLKRGVEEVLPDQAQIKVAEVVNLAFEIRR